MQKYLKIKNIKCIDDFDLKYHCKKQLSIEDK